MEYFGYLRRDPDEGGVQFWLGNEPIRRRLSAGRMVKFSDFGRIPTTFRPAMMLKYFIRSSVRKRDKHCLDQSNLLRFISVVGDPRIVQFELRPRFFSGTQHNSTHSYVDD